MMQILLKYKIPAAILFFVLQAIYLFAKPNFSNFTDAGFIPYTAILLLLIFWVIVFVDMIRNKIYSKSFWILAMIIVPFLAPAFYLFQRNRLLHLQNNRFKDN